MRSKKSLIAVTAALSFVSSSAFAHNLWVVGKNEDVLKADMVYGHHFPKVEVIPEDRLSIFEPVKVFGKDYQKDLTQKGESYHYEGDSALPEGTYILKARYKPTVWSEKADGEWVMGKTRKDIEGEVTSCTVYSMLGKTVLTVGNDDGSYAMQPIGQGVEITPLVKPGEIATGKAVKFKITRDGEPLKQAEIFGSYDGFAENDMSMPFYAKSDLKGEFQFKALQPGLWYLKAEIEEDSGNADCEKVGDLTTFTFTVQ